MSRLAVSLRIDVTECCRSPLLTQLFGVVESDPLTLVAYEGMIMLGKTIVDAEMLVELANGPEFTGRYWGKNMLVWYYLTYKFVRSAFEFVIPADKCSLVACDPIFARRRDCDLSGELSIFRIDRRIIAIRLRTASKIGL